ncbi:hybrid sensor histidine kinase/response regulator [Chitinophaga varians]|uniref:hybrid sensor histidine kinase/response regulator n=1 Tax=Chitinophaga varians TaxID=2202339 RepID=UPI00165ED074|nr:ATP-binding protein [Chitinophaga varians]MBC9909097.1 response regulator [Chitinophaga varians]
MNLKTISKKIFVLSGKIFDLGVEGEPISFHRTMTRTINIMSIINIGVGLVANLSIYLLTDIRTVLIPSLGEDLLFILVLYLNKRRLYDPAAFIMFITHCFSILYFGAKFGENSHAVTLTIYLIIAGYLVFKSNAFRVTGMAISIATFVVLQLNYQFHYIPTWQLSDSEITFIRWMIYASVMVLSGSLMYFFILRNAQEARLTEMEIASKTEKYLQAMEAKKRLLDEVTHEIANPAHILVSTVNKYIQRIENAPYINHTNISKDDLWTLVTAGRIISNQCSTILLWARNERGGEKQIDNKTMDIYTWATDIIRLYQHAASQRRIRLILNIAKNTPKYIVTDEFRVNHIVTNLITNAIKFSNEATDIDIFVRNEDENLIIEVSDHGPGISEERQRLLFEPYYTTGKTAVGIMSTGVGLALAKKYVHQINGAITLHSNVGIGTRFTVKIPLKTPSEIEINRFVNYSNYNFNGEKILVLDDDHLCRMANLSSLKKLGCKPIGAATPEEAIFIACSEEPVLILMDMELRPGINAIQVIEKLKSDKVTTKIPIVLVSSCDPGKVSEAFKAGADAYLPKPFDLIQLKEILASFIPLFQKS